MGNPGETPAVSAPAQVASSSDLIWPSLPSDDKEGKYILHLVSTTLNFEDTEFESEHQVIIDVFRLYAYVLYHDNPCATEALHRSAICYSDSQCGDMSTTMTAIRTLRQGIDDSFIISPINAKGHLFTAIIRKTSEGYSVILVNAGERSTHERFEEYIFRNEEGLFACLKPFDRDMEDIYEEFKSKSAAKNILHIKTKDQIVGNCLVKAVEKACVIAGMPMRQIISARVEPEGPRIHPKLIGGINVEERHKRIVEILSREHPELRAEIYKLQQPYTKAKELSRLLKSISSGTPSKIVALCQSEDLTLSAALMLYDKYDSFPHEHPLCQYIVSDPKMRDLMKLAALYMHPPKIVEERRLYITHGEIAEASLDKLWEEFDRLRDIYPQIADYVKKDFLEEEVTRINKIQDDRLRVLALDKLKDVCRTDFKSNMSLGKLFWSCDKYDDAIAFCHAALNINPNSYDAQKLLGICYFEKEDYDNAIPLFEAAVTSKPDDMESKIFLAKCYFYKEDYDNAIPLFEAAVTSRPDKMIPRRFLAKCYFYKEDYDKAIPLFEAAVTSKPGDMESKILLANCYFEKKDYDKAIPLFEAAVTSEPGDMESKIFLAKCYFYKNDYDKAIPLFEASVTSKPGDMESKILLANCYFYNNKYDKAIPLLEAMLTHSPDDIQARKLLANCCLCSNEYDKAIENFKDVLALNPCDMQAEGFLAYCRFLKSEEMFGRNPFNIQAKIFLANCYFARKDYGKAIPFLEEVLSHDPNDMQAKIFLATCFLHKKDYDKAIPLYKAALAQNPLDIQAEKALADCYYRKKDYDEASMILRRIIISTPDDMQSRRLLSECHIQKANMIKSVSFSPRF